MVEVVHKANIISSVGNIISEWHPNSDLCILCAVSLWVVAIWDNSHVQLSVLIYAGSSVLEAYCVSVDSEEIRIGDVFSYPCFAICIRYIIMNH